MYIEWDNAIAFILKVIKFFSIIYRVLFIINTIAAVKIFDKAVIGH